MRTLILFSLMIFAIVSCTKRQAQIELKNPTDLQRNDAFVELNWHNIFADQKKSQERKLKISQNGQSIPYQILFDGNIGLLLDFKPNEVKRLVIEKSNGPIPEYPQRAHAEVSIRMGAKFNGKKWVGGKFVSVNRVSVGRKHLIHDDLIRYEGAGWESDKIGYRLYLDRRNAIDIFGKRTNKIILPLVGQDTSQTYHEMNWWGMDVLKVGETFGVGSFALHTLSKKAFSLISEKKEIPEIFLLRPDNVDSLVCTILEDGPLRAGLEIQYRGWQIDRQKVDVVVRHFITAGSYLTSHQIKILKGQDGLVVGAMAPKETEMYIFDGHPTMRLILGIPALSGDSLAVIIAEEKQNLPSFSSIVKNNWLKYYAPGVKSVSFYSGALWQNNFPQQPFKARCLKETRLWQTRLEHPIVIKYLKEIQ